jgi:hypothetical protein
MFDTGTPLGLGIVVTLVVAGTILLFGIAGALINLIGARLDSAGDR